MKTLAGGRSSPPHRLSLRTEAKALFLPLLFLLFGDLLRAAQGQAIVSLPSASECMYFTDQNGLAEVLSYAVDGNTTIPVSTLVKTVQNVGYLPNSMAFFDNKFYVASQRSIAVFDVASTYLKYKYPEQFLTLPRFKIP